MIDPVSSSLVNPFARRARGLILAEEQQVEEMLDRLVMLRQAGPLPPEPSWVCPDRDPEPIRSGDAIWLAGRKIAFLPPPDAGGAGRGA